MLVMSVINFVKLGLGSECVCEGPRLDRRNSDPRSLVG